MPKSQLWEQDGEQRVTSKVHVGDTLRAGKVTFCAVCCHHGWCWPAQLACQSPGRYHCWMRCHSSATPATSGRLPSVIVYISCIQEPIYSGFASWAVGFSLISWMKHPYPFTTMCVWFWKDLEEDKLNFPWGRDFLLPKDYWSLNAQFVQAVIPPPRTILWLRKIERLRRDTAITLN